MTPENPLTPWNKLAILGSPKTPPSPGGQKWEPKDPNGALKQKISPDVIFGQHDQPTLKL